MPWMIAIGMIVFNKFLTSFQSFVNSLNHNSSRLIYEVIFNLQLFRYMWLPNHNAG